MAQNFLTHLRERNLVAQVSHEEELEELLKKSNTNEKGQTYGVYCGFDPTAKSLHVGNLVGLMGLRRAQDCGLTPIILFGGATGLIGDPTGRTELRQMNTKEQIADYIENFKVLAGRYFRNDVPNKPVYVNNIDWLGDMTWIEFSRTVGVHFTVARLLAAEVNKARFEHGGLTFMELGYQLLQAYDFLHLHNKFNCIIQVGGNDQWSNILAGADLIRRVEGKKAFALTYPLLVGSDGRKYGKSAGNAFWLDASMTSPYDLYQFFRNVADDDVNLFMRVFSSKAMGEITKLTDKTNANINQTKEMMAHELTALVHGEQAANQAHETAKALFSGQGSLQDAPTTVIEASEVKAGLDILSLLMKTGLVPSRGEGRKLIQGNGLTVNNEKLSDPAYVLKEKDFETEHNALVLRKGKKDYHLVRIK